MMYNNLGYYELPCSSCSAPIDINSVVCEHCGTASPQPITVKRALLASEVEALSKRYDAAKSALEVKGLWEEIGAFEKIVDEEGHAVINLNFTFLWDWLMHGSKEYQGYRRSVLDGSINRSKFENDRDRSVVESILFGTAVDIIYAALSLDGFGLKSYGPISVVLKTSAIEARTSLLEMNSYKFVDIAEKKGWTRREPLPQGSFAPWVHKEKLALVKCHDMLTKHCSVKQASSMILYSNGERSTDEFLELYIYGKLASSVVEKIKLPKHLVASFNPKEKVQYNELKRKHHVEEF